AVPRAQSPHVRLDRLERVSRNLRAVPPAAPAGRLLFVDRPEDAESRDRYLRVVLVPAHPHDFIPRVAGLVSQLLVRLLCRGQQTVLRDPGRWMELGDARRFRAWRRAAPDDRRAGGIPLADSRRGARASPVYR